MLGPIGPPLDGSRFGQELHQKRRPRVCVAHIRIYPEQEAASAQRGQHPEAPSCCHDRGTRTNLLVAHQLIQGRDQQSLRECIAVALRHEGVNSPIYVFSSC